MSVFDNWVQKQREKTFYDSDSGGGSGGAGGEPGGGIEEPGGKESQEYFGLKMGEVEISGKTGDEFRENLEKHIEEQISGKKGDEEGPFIETKFGKVKIGKSDEETAKNISDMILGLKSGKGESDFDWGSEDEEYPWESAPAGEEEEVKFEFGKGVFDNIDFESMKDFEMFGEKVWKNIPGEMKKMFEAASKQAKNEIIKTAREGEEMRRSRMQEEMMMKNAAKIKIDGKDAVEQARKWLWKNAGNMISYNEKTGFRYKAGAMKLAFNNLFGGHKSPVFVPASRGREEAWDVLNSLKKTGTPASPGGGVKAAESLDKEFYRILNAEGPDKAKEFAKMNNMPGWETL